MKHLMRMAAVVLVILVMAVPSVRATAGPPQKEGGEPLPMIMWEPANPNAWTVNGRAQVLGIIERMQALIRKIPLVGLVTSDVIGQVAALYGDNGILTSIDGTTLRGAREIAMYFRQLALCQRVADIRIEIKFVYAMEYTARARDAGGRPEDIVHSLYFILSCSFLVDRQPVMLASSTSCPHSRLCECNYGK